MARSPAKTTTSASKPATQRGATRGQTVVGDAKQAGPSHDEIAVRAYHIFLARNGSPGDAMADWLQAEHELRNQNSR